MPIDYKLATKTIDNAMKVVGSGIEKGIESLLGGNYNSRPAFAFAGGPDPKMYKPRTDNAPTLDSYLADSRNATKPTTNIPPAKYFLQQLYG